MCYVVDNLYHLIASLQVKQEKSWIDPTAFLFPISTGLQYVMDPISDPI